MGVYGPYFAGTIANGGGSDLPWSNPNNAGGDDGVYTSDWGGGNGTSQYLKFTNFGITGIGSTEIIAGVVVLVERYASNPIAIRDSGVFLIVDSNMGNDDHSIIAPWDTAVQIVAYGGEPDNWGFSLTPTNVQSSNFGFALRTLHTTSPPVPYTAYIDYAKLTVYTLPSGTYVSISGDISFFITGYIPQNSSIPLYLCNNPPASISGNIPLYIRGVPFGTGENFDVFPLSIEGSLSQSSGLPLYINNNPTSESVVTLYTKGISSSTNNLPFFVQNVPQSGGQSYLNLFTQGRGTDGLTGEEPSSGLPSGVFATHNSFTLYLNTADGLTVPGGGVGMNMYLGASLTDDTTSNMNMFIGGNIWYPGAANNLPLFLYNSVEPLHNSVNLYTKGLGSVDSEGYTPKTGGMNMFIQRNIPAKIDFYIQGPGTVFTQGMNLYMMSGLTKASGIAFSMPQTKGSTTGGLRLYSHGY